MNNKYAFGLGILATVGVLVIAGMALATITNNGNGTWTFSYTVANAEASRISNAFAGLYKYQDTLYYPNGTAYANPQTKGQFAESKIKGYIKEVVVAYELEQARAAVATPTEPTVS